MVVYHLGNIAKAAAIILAMMSVTGDHSEHVLIYPKILWWSNMYHDVSHTYEGELRFTFKIYEYL